MTMSGWTVVAGVAVVFLGWRAWRTEVRRQRAWLHRLHTEDLRGAGFDGVCWRWPVEKRQNETNVA